jgi:hypothetical protein
MGPGPEIASGLAGNVVAAGTAWCSDGDGSGEGDWPVLTTAWLDGRMFTDGEPWPGRGGGPIGFVDARLEPLLEWVLDPGRVFMSGMTGRIAVCWRGSDDPVRGRVYMCGLPMW